MELGFRFDFCLVLFFGYIQQCSGLTTGTDSGIILDSAWGNILGTGD